MTMTNRIIIIVRIGDMLLDHYGPTMYSKMTSEFDPVGLAALDSQLGQYQSRSQGIMVWRDIFVRERLWLRHNTFLTMTLYLS